MKFSEKMWLMIIVKVPRKQDLTLLFLKKAQERVKFDPPPVFFGLSYDTDTQ